MVANASGSTIHGRLWSQLYQQSLGVMGSWSRGVVGSWGRGVVGGPGDGVVGEARGPSQRI